MNKLLAFSVPGYSNLQTPNDIPTLDNTSVGHIIGFLLNMFIFAGIMAAIVFMVYAGFRWVSSGGDKQKIESARKVIIFCVAGIVLMVLSLAIVNFIGTILGVHYF